MSLEHLDCSWLSWYVILSSSSVDNIALLQSGWEPSPEWPLSTQSHPFLTAVRCYLSKVQRYTIQGGCCMVMITSLYVWDEREQFHMWRFDAASYQPTSSRHYIPAKNMRYRSNRYTTKQVPTLLSIQGGERTERSPESMCIRSQSVPIGPIEGQKIDLLELKYWLHQPFSMNRTCLSAIDCFVIFPYTYITTSKNKIGGRVDK